MKKIIPVSQIASMIYKTRKQAALNSSSDFDSKEEWKKSMKQAWETVHSTKESRSAKRKAAGIIQEEKRKEAWARKQEITKNALDKIKIKLDGQKDKSIGQMIAEGASKEDQRLKERGINPRVW